MHISTRHLPDFFDKRRREKSTFEQLGKKRPTDSEVCMKKSPSREDGEEGKELLGWGQRDEGRQMC